MTESDLRLIRDSAGGIAPRTGDLKRIRALRFTTHGFDPAIWQQICDLGWPGLALSEAQGGSALGMAAFCALAEELGAALVPEPLISAALAASGLSATHNQAHLAGTNLILPAWQEQPDSLARTWHCQLRDGRLSGRKYFVVQAAAASSFIVTTAQGLALVAAAGEGVHLSVEKTQDGGHFGTLDFTDAPAEPLSADHGLAIEEATLATAATLLGVADRAFAITLDYLKSRSQFGKPIGSFQALQHRMADLKIQLELTRASITAAAHFYDQGGTEALRLAAISRAKARASDSALLITRQAIQLHGGIGYTDEADIGLYLRKAMVLANLYGSAASHRARFAALSKI